MTFKKVMRGYDPQEVDKYISENDVKNKALLATQKQHIDELADENYSLRKQLEQYKADEQAISKALVDSQKLADELQGNAEKFAEVTLARAKLFYAAWNAYAQTLVSTLSPEELRQFNTVKQRLENAIYSYDGGSVREYAASLNNASAGQRYNAAAAVAGDEQPTEREIQAQMRPLTSNSATNAPSAAAERAVGSLTNPIEKVQQASGHAIDLKELIKPEESLADLCKDLGLGIKK